MDSGQLKKLRQFYYSLLGQQRILDTISDDLIEGITILPLEVELQRLQNEFPELISPFNREDYFIHFAANTDRRIYGLIGIRSYVAIALGRLQIAIEQPTGMPVTEERQFAFVSDSALRKIIERDYVEIQKAYISECWKSVIILCGGAIEAILTDLLIQNETAATAAKSAPKNSDITRWDLSNLIDVAVELLLVSAGIEKLSHSLREYRNLVHPGNELRNKLRFDAEEAKIAVEFLNIVHRDLSH
jgi:hypothetical protein